MSDLEARIEQMEAQIELMMKQIDELYSLECANAHPFMAFLTGGQVTYRKPRDESS